MAPAVGPATRSLSVDEYRIGIICALPKELKAVNAILDERHEPLKSKDATDYNSYVLGRIGQHNVVAAGLPAGVYGTTSAASVAKDMLRTFHGLRFGILVGIAGGCPDLQAKRDIRLGDVVVSQPAGTHGGVVQYDLGKLLSDGRFELKGTLNKPPQTLLTALTNLQADLHSDESIHQYLEQIDRRYPSLQGEGYTYPGTQQDVLHCARCDPSQWWWTLWLVIVWLWPLWRCERCEKGKIIRPLRRSTTPIVHYGTVASANTLLKNAIRRDRLAKDLGALCVEMEAAGLDDYPCLVIRGICDYSDADKNDVWQEYAALTAAAFAKMLLGYVSPQAVRGETLIQTVLDKLDHNLQRQHEHNVRIDDHHKRQEVNYHDDKHMACHRVFDISNYEEDKNFNNRAVPGTCRWVLDDPRFRDWLLSDKGDLLWISADPGCGKSVLSRSLVDIWLRSTDLATTTEPPGGQQTICYFFFKDNEDQSSLSTALCAILHQIFSYHPELIHHALPVYSKHKEERLTSNVGELWRLLLSATTETSTGPIICVLDALDECCDIDRQRLVGLLCDFHEASTSSSRSQSRLKWLVTSRPHDDIQGYFGKIPAHLPSIRLRGEDKDDQVRREIDLVIDQRMEELGRQLCLSNAKREEIANELREMDNRTYLWLHLVLEDIEVKIKKSPRPNQEKIVALPATVDQAYENILNRVEDVEQRHWAKTALKIIVGASRPLSVDEMALAFDIATLPEAPGCRADLTIDGSTLGDKIRGWCGLFVFIKHNHLYLIHQTAKEFLLRHHNEAMPTSQGWKHCLHSLDIDKEMAKICVFFLCLSEFDIMSSDVSESLERIHDPDPLSSIRDIDNDRPGFRAFFAFASVHWVDYVRKVEEDLDHQVFLKMMALYNSKSGQFRRWTSVIERMSLTSRSIESGRSRVHWASYNGHCVALWHFLSISPDSVNQVTQKNRTPLMEAAFQGHVKVVRMLLAQPCIEVNLVDKYGNTALSRAATRGHIEVVWLLLAQPDIAINIQNEYDMTALCGAASEGYTAVVQLLLSHRDIDTNIQDKSGMTALSKAASEGNIEAVQLLLSHRDIDTNIQDKSGMTALSKAASEGYTAVVRLLLRHPDIHINIQDKGGMPALFEAASEGNTAVVRLLLAHN